MTPVTPTTELEVIGLRGSTVVTAVVDTGFDGEVCLPTRIAVPLGLVLGSQELIELADGTEKNELVFEGAVRFLDAERQVDIYLTESDEALVGTGLLHDCRLNIDFANGSVRITRKKPGKRHRRQ